MTSKKTEIVEKDTQVKMKDIKLKAFKVENNSVSKSSSNLFSCVVGALDGSESVEDRCMRVSADDPEKEQYLISNYLSHAGKFICCTFMKIAPGDQAEHVTKELFAKKKFTLEELGSETIETAAICKEYHYLIASDNFLVTNQPINRTIISLQTYLRWLTKNDAISLTPVIDMTNKTKIEDIRSIIMRDPSVGASEDEPENSVSDNKNAITRSFEKAVRLSKLSVDVIRGLIKEADKFSDMQLNQLISAELVLKLKKKPKEMTDKDYESIIGATLKPVSELDNISFKRRNGPTEIKGKDLIRIKEVKVEKTNSGKLSEPQLFQEMRRFISELEKNEKNN
ncbi:TPA: hypothetical protein ACS724_003908 [Providencia alcalifaciens]